ncbi:MAG: DUF1295 domain-containing protein, partial [Actinobacteria bacterium]|nr:DUF1295 domain-containing protein [Actinomycetota bacterium]
MISDTLITSALVIVGCMVGMWLLSVILKNASIVDIFWGLGFVIVAWASAIQVDAISPVGKVLVSLVSLWGLRLSTYLWIRNHGKP